MGLTKTGLTSGVVVTSSSRNSEFYCIYLYFMKFKSAEIGPSIPVSILHKSTEGRYRPVRVADGPRTARCRSIKNASWV